jgi:hypothetical protein
MNPSDPSQDQQDKQNKQDRQAKPQDPDNPELQGEGNYVAGRRYDEAQRRFVESGQVDDAARKAKPQNTREAEELDAAEQEGRSHAKGEDPALGRGRS